LRAEVIDIVKERYSDLPVHQPRYRRDCVGELIQIDGSEHWWFERPRAAMSLLVYIDDATSRLMHLQFVESESTFDYFATTRAYLERHGKPVAFYSDKHGVLDAVGGDGRTQFGRALHALNIASFAPTPPRLKAAASENRGVLIGLTSGIAKECTSNCIRVPRRRCAKTSCRRHGRVGNFPTSSLGLA
jgi:hypothetical protein